MKKLLIITLPLLLWFCSCSTKQEIIDTGVSDPLFNGSMMQYLRSDDYNWKLTVELIERAGLTDLFEGRVDSLKQITFLGFKSHSVLRFLLDSQYQDPSNGVFVSVADIPVEMAREIVLKHVIADKHLKKDIAYRNKQYIISDPRQDGGTIFTTLGGNKVLLYLEGSAYGGVPDAGPVTLSVYSLTVQRIIPMATPDIQPANGVVHALNYGYELAVI